MCARQIKDGSAKLEPAYAATWDLSADSAGEPRRPADLIEVAKNDGGIAVSADRRLLVVLSGATRATAAWLAFGPDSKTLWTGPWPATHASWTGRARRWDVPAGKELDPPATPAFHPNGYGSFALTREAKTLYVADRRRGVWVCDPVTGRPKSEPKPVVPAPAPAPRLVTAGSGG